MTFSIHVHVQSSVFLLITIGLSLLIHVRESVRRYHRCVV